MVLRKLSAIYPSSALKDSNYTSFTRGQNLAVPYLATNKVTGKNENHLLKSVVYNVLTNKHTNKTTDQHTSKS